MRRPYIWTTAFVTLTMFVMLSCGTLWESKIAFEGPVHRGVIEIDQPFPTNGWGLRISLSDAGAKKILYQVRGDVFLNFADVVWADNGRFVIVFTCGTPQVRQTYDTSSGSVVQLPQMESLVATHIRATYHLGPDSVASDITDWACSEAGKQAFLRNHRNAAPR